MPRVNQKKADYGWKPTSDYEKSEFIQYELTKDDIALLKKEYLPKFELDHALIQLVEDGYKITIKYDDKNRCASCFLFPPASDVEKKGLVLTGRGSNAKSALIEVSFKHWVLFDANWPARADVQRNKSWDE